MAYQSALLRELLTQVLKPIGFRRKSSCWIALSGELTKVVNLQKSGFGNQYYINYGYIINSVPLCGTMMHIYKRLASPDPVENRRIQKLLDLEAAVTDEVRSSELTRLIKENMIADLQRTNTEGDLLQDLKERSHLNGVPLVVKKHFRLAVD